jgi:hypothetical protein
LFCNRMELPKTVVIGKKACEKTGSKP